MQHRHGNHRNDYVCAMKSKGEMRSTESHVHQVLAPSTAVAASFTQQVRIVSVNGPRTTKVGVEPMTN
jgi:hypothetical protein